MLPALRGFSGSEGWGLQIKGRAAGTDALRRP